MIVYGICRVVDKKQIPKWHNWPETTQMLITCDWRRTSALFGSQVQVMTFARAISCSGDVSISWVLTADGSMSWATALRCFMVAILTLALGVRAVSPTNRITTVICSPRVKDSRTMSNVLQHRDPSLAALQCQIKSSAVPNSNRINSNTFG